MTGIFDENRLRTLSLEDRFVLLTRVWESILNDETGLERPSSEWIDELKLRWAELKAHPERGTPWEEFEAEMLTHLSHVRISSKESARKRFAKRRTDSKRGRKGAARTSSPVSSRR
jgi:putative addiction module component (TIGR02574 family)